MITWVDVVFAAFSGLMIGTAFGLKVGERLWRYGVIERRKDTGNKMDIDI